MKRYEIASYPWALLRPFDSLAINAHCFVLRGEFPTLVGTAGEACLKPDADRHRLPLHDDWRRRQRHCHCPLINDRLLLARQLPREQAVTQFVVQIVLSRK